MSEIELARLKRAVGLALAAGIVDDDETSAGFWIPYREYLAILAAMGRRNEAADHIERLEAAVVSLLPWAEKAFLYSLDKEPWPSLVEARALVADRVKQ